jgi:hypothetical protein
MVITAMETESMEQPLYRVPIPGTIYWVRPFPATPTAPATHYAQ